MGQRTKRDKEKMFMKNIGAFVKETRYEKKKTQSFVADWLGVTFQQIQKYEKNSNDLGLWNFVVLCEKFDLDPSLVISQAKDNMYLPDKLIEEGKIQVSTSETPLIQNNPIFEMEKNEND